VGRRKSKARVVRTRDAFAGPGRVVVRCDCGKRLGEQWPTDDRRTILTTGETTMRVEGPWYVPVQHGTYHQGAAPGESGATHGIKNIAHEDWLSVTCTKCSRTWQGRDWQVASLVIPASDAGQRDVRLSMATGLAPMSARPTSVRWWTCDRGGRPGRAAVQLKRRLVDEFTDEEVARGLNLLAVLPSPS